LNYGGWVVRNDTTSDRSSPKALAPSAVQYARHCAGTLSPLEYVVYGVSTSIRVSEETKRKLEILREEGETFDELLARLARTEKDVEAMAGFAGEDYDPEAVEQARETAREEFGERADATDSGG
jgi:predicted CopG family antitoxin